MALTLTLGANLGVANNYLPYVDFRSIAVENSVEVASDTMSCDIYIYNNEIPAPREGWEIIFEDGGTREFAGVVTSINRKFASEGLGIVYQLACRDYVYFLNRRLVNEAYVSQVAGQTIKDILTDLFNASDSDAHYQYFKDNVTNIENGPVLRAFTFDEVLPSQVFDSIAQATGMQWWIGFNKQVYFKQFDVTTASHLPSGILDIDTDITNYFDWEEEGTIEDIGTQLKIKDVESLSTATQIDLFDPVGTKAADHHAQARKIFYLSRRPFNVAHVTDVEKDTGGGYVSQTLNVEDIDGTPAGGEGGATDVFIKVTEREQSYVRFANANAVATTDKVRITYKYAVQDTSEGIDTTGVAEMKARTGGDGIHQFLYTQASGLRVEALSELEEIERILLNRKSRVLRRGTFSSWTKGWQAGQVFQRRWVREGLDDFMYVISVSKSVLTPADDPNLADNVVLSTITFSNIPHGVAF